MAYPFGNWQSNPYIGMPPMGFGQNQYQQQMAQQAAPQSGGQNPFTMVPTITDVDKVMVQPGETRWIMVQNEPVMAVKKADTMGYASGEYYRLTKIDPAAMQTPAPGCNYVTVSATLAPTAAGTVTLTGQKDGVAVIGATASQAVAAAAAPTTLALTFLVRNACGCESSILSFLLTGTAAVVNNLAVTVEKL